MIASLLQFRESLMRDSNARSARCAALCITLAAIAVSSTLVQARTWYILPDGSGDAPTIQAGVDAADPGDIVLVASGTYPHASVVEIDGVLMNVCVVVTKEIKLISESRPSTTTIGGPGIDVAIYFQDVGSAAEISGFRIETTFAEYFCIAGPVATSTPAQLDFDIGIKCKNASVRIEDNHIRENGIGIDLVGSQALISGNTISAAFFGVACNDASDATITNNLIHDCAYLVRSIGSSPLIAANDLYDGCTAVSSNEGSSPHVVDNSIHNNSPIAVDCGLGGPTIENNLFANNNLPVRLQSMTGTTIVRGNTFYNQLSSAVSLSDNLQGSITIENNTIDRSTSYAIFCQRASSPLIRNNIIVRSAGGVSCVLSSFPTFECNNIFDVADQRYAGDCSDQTGINGNISVDPQFCGIPDSGNHDLQSDSPCAPGNHPDGCNCGQIGARGVACGAVSTKSVTWGEVKAMYRRE